MMLPFQKCVFLPWWSNKTKQHQNKAKQNTVMTAVIHLHQCHQCLILEGSWHPRKEMIADCSVTGHIQCLWPLNGTGNFFPYLVENYHFHFARFQHLISGFQVTYLWITLFRFCITIVWIWKRKNTARP